MRAMSRQLLGLFLCASLWLNIAAAQAAKSSSSEEKKASSGAKSVDLTKQPTLYVVGYAHLDTEWRWEYPQTIGEYLKQDAAE